jgi:hypothetical protein
MRTAAADDHRTAILTTPPPGWEREVPKCRVIHDMHPAEKAAFSPRASASKALSANKVSACISGSIASAPSKSWACPVLSRKASGLPSASTMAWILALNLLRPIAWPSPSFFRAGSRFTPTQIRAQRPLKKPTRHTAA